MVYVINQGGSNEVVCSRLLLLLTEITLLTFSTSGQVSLRRFKTQAIDADNASDILNLMDLLDKSPSDVAKLNALSNLAIAA